MAERDYLHAALPDRVTLLGQSLRPFSLGHLMLLTRSQNCFVVPGAKATIETLANDLVVGVFICSQTYEQAIVALESEWLWLKFRLWGWRRPKFDVLDKAEAFRDYIREGSRSPDLWEPASDNVRFPGAPFIQRVRIILQSKLNHSLAEAWNKPWGEAIHDYFAYWEIEDRAKIINDDERELMVEMPKDLVDLDAFLDTKEFKRFLAKEVAAEKTRGALEGD